MIRTTKHNINNITNKGKQSSLDKLFIDYKHDLVIYLNYIIDGTLPLKNQLSSKLLPTENILHSRYKQIIYKQASEIIRSQLDKAKKKRYNKYKKCYSYFKKNSRQISFTDKKFSELSLNDILKSKYFTIPNLNNLSINLDERFFDIQSGNHFDSFINIKLPYFNEKGTRALKINIPLKHHKHSNKLKSEGFKLRNNIQIKNVNGNYLIHLIYEKTVDLRTSGSSLGIDMGYKKLVVTSNSEYLGKEMELLYDKISTKKQGSKAFKRLLTHRDNEINRYCNLIDIEDVKQVVIEDLKSVKSNSKGKIYKKFNNKLQRWSYIKTIDKITRICEVNGIILVKVSPAYTSQTCSNCGETHKESRLGETYKCVSCLYEIDADYNASININNRGVTYSLSNHDNFIIIPNND